MNALDEVREPWVRRILRRWYPEVREDTIARLLREMREEADANMAQAVPCDCQHCSPREEAAP